MDIERLKVARKQAMDIFNHSNHLVSAQRLREWAGHRTDPSTGSNMLRSFRRAVEECNNVVR